MIPRELAPLTTFKLGGSAAGFLAIENTADLGSAYEAVRASAFAILGGGSNVLVPDEGIDGLVIKVDMPGIEFEVLDAERVRMILGAGVVWDTAVEEAARRGLWGIENLAGIPGTCAGAAVQNIGAYGADLATTFEYADMFDLASGAVGRIERSGAAFAYRDSVFKHERAWLITRVALALTPVGQPNLSYKDVHVAHEAGVPLATPQEIGTAVRAIRARKFPDLSQEGTAGSFFKNPIVSRKAADALQQSYPGLPQFVQPGGAVKISLAWLLDHALHLKGLARGDARLFENQPLVIVAARGAQASDVENLARMVEEKVIAATGIKIEREVETFSARKLSTHRA